MKDRTPQIGIDFGTTNSSVAWYNPRTAQAEVILNAEGEAKTPSVVYFGEGETLVGKPVDELIEDVATEQSQRQDVFRRTVASIKRALINPPRIALPGGRYVGPVEVVAEILGKLKRDAEDGHFHEEVGRAVITCPAEFNILQRRKIEEAGYLAGFGEVVLLEEPVAGALAYAREGLDVGRYVLVYDLGGGTFDLAVLENEDKSFRVALQPKGMDRCGGDDFDLALYHHCEELARQDLDRSISPTGEIDKKFLQSCRRRKESLSWQERATFSSLLSSDDGVVKFTHDIDQKTFEGLIDPYIETTLQLTGQILEEADEKGYSVDTAVLIGGSSRVPAVLRRLGDTLPVNPLGFDKKDVAVALGAAHYTEVHWPLEEPAPSQEPTPLDRYREEYRQAVEMVWADGKLDGLEAEWLGELADRLGLDPELSASVEGEVMGAARGEIQTKEGEPAPEVAWAFRPGPALAGHSDAVHSVAISPDGEFLASGGADHRVEGWNAHTGQSVGALTGHSGRVNCVAFSPDGELLASGGADRTIRIWKLPHGEPLHTLDHSEWVFSVAVSPDSRLLASGGADGEVRLWDLQTGEPVRTLAGHKHWVLSVAIGPGGEMLVSGGADGRVRVWKLPYGEPLHTFERPDRVWSVAVSSDGSLIAGGGEDGSIEVWDAKTSEPFQDIAPHPAPAVHSITFSPDGDLLFSGGADGKVRVRELESGELLDILRGHSKGVSSVAISPDGGLLASASYDQKIKLWRKEVMDDSITAAGREQPGGKPETVPEKPQHLPD